MTALRDDLVALEGYHSPQVTVAVRLNTNESPYPPPLGWQEALAEAVATIPFHRYPDRTSADLRAALADLHGVTPDHIYAANGSNEVLQALLLAYGGHGRTAAVFSPTYALHSHIARITGTAVEEGERHPDFTLDLAEVERVVRGATPAITFLCSPNNPTGRLEDPDTVVRVESLLGADGILVVDEAYGQFAKWSAVEWVAAGRRIVVTRTYSKTWSMAAARLGYAIAPPEIVRDLEMVTLPYHLDAMKQVAGTLALRFRAEMDSRVRLLVAERERLVERLRALPVETWPSDANFVLFRPRDRDGHEVWQALLDRSVLVRDFSRWPRLEGCLRVTIGTPEEDDAFLGALTEVLG